MSRGSISTTGRRSTSARRSARSVSATAVAGPCSRSATAPTDGTSWSWSIRKLERIAAAAVSAASSSRGVRLFAASVRPVIVLVRPGPWCTVHNPTRPVTCAYASAIEIAPPSWRAATNVAPPATSALVTAKLPLPIRPKTWRTPRSASARPTASATSTALLTRDEGEDAGRAARATHDRQGCGYQDCAGRRQARQIRQLGQPVLLCTKQELVARKGRLEAMRGAGIGADSFNAEANHRCLLAEPARELHRHAGRVWARFIGIEERLLIVRASVPAGSEQQPTAFGQRAVLLLPFLDVADVEE